MFVLRDDQQVEVNLTYRDAKNQPTNAENATLMSADSSIIAVEKLADNKFKLTAGNVGITQVSASADARIGAGELLITGAEMIQVVAGEAAVMNLEFAEPSQQ